VLYQGPPVQHHAVQGDHLPGTATRGQKGRKGWERWVLSLDAQSRVPVPVHHRALQGERPGGRGLRSDDAVQECRWSTPGTPGRGWVLSSRPDEHERADLHVPHWAGGDGGGPVGLPQRRVLCSEPPSLAGGAQDEGRVRVPVLQLLPIPSACW